MTRFLLGYFLFAVPAALLAWACCVVGAQADAQTCRGRAPQVCEVCRRAGCDGTLVRCTERWR